MAARFDMREVLADAVRLYSPGTSTPDGRFNSYCFGKAMKGRFDLARVPDGDWCRAVLEGLAYVESMGDGVSWKFRPDLGLSAWRRPFALSHTRAGR